MSNLEFSGPRRLHNNKSGGSPLVGPCARSVNNTMCVYRVSHTGAGVDSIRLLPYLRTQTPLLWENLTLALGHASPCKHFLTFLEPVECVWVRAGYGASKMFEELGVCFLLAQECYHI